MRNFSSSQPSVRASKRRVQQTCTWMNTEIALRHIGHGSPFLVSTSAQSPHANWCPQGTATCDLVPMKQMEHVVPPPKVEVSSAMLGRQAERSRGGRHHCRYSRSLRRLSSAIPRREGADTEIISGFSLRKQVDRVRNVESSGKTQDEVEQ